MPRPPQPQSGRQLDPTGPVPGFHGGHRTWVTPSKDDPVTHHGHRAVSASSVERPNGSPAIQGCRVEFCAGKIVGAIEAASYNDSFFSFKRTHMTSMTVA